ncbi:MAG: tetratricopeptide repeat protein [Candidatus Wallbacteria bacterium]|nr:tetratricopeptide repeat protein [Candidatus Wallbacteria bacterium]
MLTASDRRFEQGLEFFRQADYQSAIRLWRSLLEEGDPRPDLGLYLWAAQSEYGRMLQTVERLASGFEAPEVNAGQDLLAKARQALSRKCHREALDLAGQALAEDPDLAAAREVAARAALLAGQLSEALGHAREAARLRPGAAPAQSLLGEVLAEMGRTTQADLAFETALSRDQRHAPAWYGRAVLRYRDRHLADAARLAARALEISPQLGAARSFLDEVTAEIRRVEEQLEEGRRVAVEHPEWPDWHHKRAAAAASLGLEREALAACESALVLNPGMAKTWHLKAQLELAAGDARLACLSLERAARAAGACRVEPAESLALAGDFRSAATAWLEALRPIPDYASRHIELGKKLYRDGLRDDAERALARGLSLAPHYADGHHVLGLIALDRARPDDAVAHLKAALAASPDFKAAAVELVRAYFAGGNAAAARHTLNQWRSRLEADAQWGAVFRDLEKRIRDTSSPKARSTKTARRAHSVPAQAKEPPAPSARRRPQAQARRRRRPE